MFEAKNFVERAVAEIDEQVTGKAVIACSGGVDSTTAAKLAEEAIGDDLLAVFVDTGFMRKGEPERVEELFDDLGLNYELVDARDRFFEELDGVTDPEEKRQRIGELFIQIFERHALDFGADYLVQGTIAPDWIESGDEMRDTIKSHHNVGGLPDKMDLELVEPLRDLYKDEVRQAARHLDVPVSEEQPFPGPGLAIRVMGEPTPERVEIVREACHIVEEEIDDAVEDDEMERPWQYFAVLLPVRTVGVQGDVRAYGRTVAVRAVGSLDGMSANYSPIPHDVLDRIATRITNTLKDEVNRVVYDVTNKPPGTVEWE